MLVVMLAAAVLGLAMSADAGYVLHCFPKTTQQTSERDIRLARKRFKELTEVQK